MLRTRYYNISLATPTFDKVFDVDAYVFFSPHLLHFLCFVVQKYTSLLSAM